MKIQHIHLTMNFIRSLFFMGACVSSPMAVPAQTTYPYNFTYEGNPLVRHHGAADPDVHVWDDTIWMYCSQDHQEGPGKPSYSAMDGYHVFSSTDMINWTDHGEIFHSRDVNWGMDGYMWAPGVARKDGKYYLYYSHLDTDKTWRVGVAIGDAPRGPFTDIGHPIEGIRGIDPMIFIDDDGEAYIYNNSFIVAKLKTNMIELAETPRKIDYSPSDVKEDKMRRFCEGSYMHKKDGVYYFSYSNFHNDQYQGFYAMGDNPYGPFDWKGPLAPNPQGAQDHHSVIEFNDQWYYFYHIAVPGIPEIKDGQGRIACFDRLYYKKDGTIQLVVHTYGPTHILTTGAPHGAIILDPPGHVYSPGTVVTLTGVGGLGFAFNAWGDDLSGSENPESITMDTDKRVSATFDSVPIYALTRSATNGSIELDPPGGIYSSGVVVTLTPVGDFGYNFSSWSGDLSGSQTPITITMDAERNVSASFKSVPTYTVTTDASRGSIELNPPGGNYEEGTEVTVTAKPNFGYEFSEWSGDLSGKQNPVTISIDSDKKIIVSCGPSPSESVPWREDFTLPDGTNKEGPPTSWGATRLSAILEVQNNQIVVNDDGEEGVLTTGIIDVSSGPVNVSLELFSEGSLENADYVRLYKIVNVGAEELIEQRQGNQTATTLSGTGISGSTLQLVIKTKVSHITEYYYLDNLSVTSGATPID